MTNVETNARPLRLKLVAAIALLTCTLLATAAEAASNQDFEAALSALATARSYPDKEAAATAISASGDPRAVAVLAALIDGQIYTGRNDNRVVIGTTVDGGYAVRDALTNEDLGVVGRRDVNRVTVNNQLRGSVRALLATLKVGSTDPKQRIAAIEEVGQAEDPAMIATLEALRAKESRSDVIAAIDTAIATLNLDSADPGVRLASIRHLGADMSSHVRMKLTNLANDEALDEQTRSAARDALAHIHEQSRALRADSDRVLRAEPRLDSRARGHRSLRDFRHHGCHQHGARRAA